MFCSWFVRFVHHRSLFDCVLLNIPTLSLSIHEIFSKTDLLSLRVIHGALFILVDDGLHSDYQKTPRIVAHLSRLSVLTCDCKCKYLIEIIAQNGRGRL